MLKGINPVISPDLLKYMAEMGHGDELVLADAHFPGHSLGKRILRADGLAIPSLLAGICPLFELDTYSPPLIMMAPVAGDPLDPRIAESYLDVVDRCSGVRPPIVHLERFAFYERVRSAYLVVMSGDRAKYGNLILVKGVTAS